MHSTWSLNQPYHNQVADKSNLAVGSNASPSYQLSQERTAPRIDEQHQTRRLPSAMSPYTEESNYHTGSDLRHTYPSGNLTATSPNGPRFTNAWPSLPSDRGAHQTQLTPAPLTLQIPGDAQELPRISTDVNSFNRTPLPRHQTTTSLPSFATLREHAGRDEPDDLYIAPMSARLQCYCTRLSPLIRDVASAVIELDEILEACGNRPTFKPSDLPKDDPVRTVQWVLERLTNAKREVQDAWRRSQVGYHAQLITPYSGAPSHQAPSPNLLKRHAWDHDELPEAKRRQSVYSTDGLPTSHSVQELKKERRSSVGFITGLPQPTESAPGLAHGRSGSPGRPQRTTLPSPTSVVNPSATPSIPAQTLVPGGSPTNSLHPTVSIHTASTNSVTSEHIANLQHQVTLKSLALQTLQSEYSSLLQKLQRERVKSQTIERKTNVADQEVNDLTTRNEGLAEQVRSLEAQLEASERKRDDDRAQAGREKEQWQRMLELGGRLQSKHAEEKQKLLDECDALARKLATYEAGTSDAMEISKHSIVSQIANSLRPQQPVERPSIDLVPRSAGDGIAVPEDVRKLKQEIADLNSRIDFLRFALEEAQRHNQFITAHTSEFNRRSEQIADVVKRALEDGDPERRRQSPIQEATLRPGEQLARLHDHTGRQGSDLDNLEATRPSASNSGQVSRKASQSTVSSSATMASMARAVSPGPAELGFHVTPSTSSPEELIQALGPVPTPLASSSVPFTTTPYTPTVDARKPSGKPKRARQGRRQSAAEVVVGSWMLPSAEERQQQQQHDPRAAFNIGAFRPLSHEAASNTISPHTTTFASEHSPHSYHSSPGPTRGGSSPGSAGSVEAAIHDSSSQPKEANGPPSLLLSRPTELNRYRTTGPETITAAMPPPPRPIGPVLSPSYEKRPAL